jgi:hypothetical protein
LLGLLLRDAAAYGAGAAALLGAGAPANGCASRGGRAAHRVTATVDPSVGEAQARAVLKDGRRLEKFAEHAVGSVERPLHG